MLNCVSKFAVRVLPSILDYREQTGAYPRALVFSLAALIAFYRVGEPNDDAQITEFMKKASTLEILSDASLWGADLTGLLPEVQANLDQIERGGVRSALQLIIQ